MSKQFHLGDLLSITTGIVLSPDGMAGIYRICDYMTGRNNFTHQLPRVSGECAPYLLKQHPALCSADAKSAGDAERTGSDWRTWLDEQIARFGEYLPVEPLPPGASANLDPIAELKEMTKRPVVVVIVGDEVQKGTAN